MYTWREQIQRSNSNLKFVRAMRISTSGIGSKSCQKLWLAKFTEYISFHSKRLSHHHFVHLFYIAFWQLRKTFIQKLNSFAWATWMCNICLEGGFFFCFLNYKKNVLIKIQHTIITQHWCFNTTVYLVVNNHWLCIVIQMILLISS